jgi:hypothetical protein
LVRQRYRRPHLTAPDSVQTGVDDDPVQPGRHRGVAAEGVRTAECGDERILHRICRFFRIAKGAECDRPQSVTVAADDLAEGLRVASHMHGEQELVGRIGVCDRRLASPASPEP